MTRTAKTREARRRELGAGLAFPLRIDDRGRFAMSTGPRKVAESILLVIETAVGERVMRSQFGSRAPDLLFEGITPGTVSQLQDAIEVALAGWEPRIDVVDVTVARDPEIETKLIASVEYRLRANNSLFNQVFPFYLSEGAEEIA